MCRLYKCLFSSQEDRNSLQPYHLPYTQAHKLFTLIYTHLDFCLDWGWSTPCTFNLNKWPRLPLPPATLLFRRSGNGLGNLEEWDPCAGPVWGRAAQAAHPMRFTGAGFQLVLLWGALVASRAAGVYSWCSDSQACRQLVLTHCCVQQLGADTEWEGTDISRFLQQMQS